MRFSLELIPEHPVAELMEAIELAEELGFYGCYGADEIYHKDVWQILATAATRTTKIRLGLGATHVILRDPTFVAQAIATLDELSGGRALAALGIGNVAMLGQYGVDVKTSRPLARLREAHAVVRTMLDEGQVDYEGEFYRYRSVFTAARPVQPHVTVLIAATQGPRTFELGGEVADGLYAAGAYSHEALEYAASHFRVGAEKVGRDWTGLDATAGVLGVVAGDSAAAKQAARVLVAFYIPSKPRKLVERHGIAFGDVQPVADAFRSGDIQRAIELTTPELAERFAYAGTPDEWIERIRADVATTGFANLVITFGDPFLIELWSKRKVDGVPDLKGQLTLIAEKVMPAFV